MGVSGRFRLSWALRGVRPDTRDHSATTASSAGGDALKLNRLESAVRRTPFTGRGRVSAHDSICVSGRSRSPGDDYAIPHAIGATMSDVVPTVPKVVTIRSPGRRSLRRVSKVPIVRDLTTCPPAHSPTGVRSLPRRGPDATTHRQFHWGSRDARRSRSLQQRLPQTVYTSIGICRQRYKPPPVSVWQRAANSRLDKFRHSLPLLDGRNFRPPVHLNIKR